MPSLSEPAVTGTAPPSQTTGGIIGERKFRGRVGGYRSGSGLSDGVTDDRRLSAAGDDLYLTRRAAKHITEC